MNYIQKEQELKIQKELETMKKHKIDSNSKKIIEKVIKIFIINNLIKFIIYDEIIKIRLILMMMYFKEI